MQPGTDVHAFEVNGDFDISGVGQEHPGRQVIRRGISAVTRPFHSANSISVEGSPPAVYPFLCLFTDSLEATVHSQHPLGNFGNMMGTVIAGKWGFP